MLTPILQRLVNQLMEKGKSKDVAEMIATKSLQRSGNLIMGTQQPTEKGLIRGAMTPEQREASRKAAKKRYINKGMKLPKIKF